jgi:hypothetical protein
LIKGKVLNLWIFHSLVLKFLGMNNLFKLRKVNKVLKNNSDSFLGMGFKEIDLDLKEFYENKLKLNNINC